MNELIIKIGPLFWVLSVLAVYALAVVAERILYFTGFKLILEIFKRYFQAGKCRKDG